MCFGVNSGKSKKYIKHKILLQFSMKSDFPLCSVRRKLCFETWKARMEFIVF